MQVNPIMDNEFKTICHLIITQFHNLSYNMNICEQSQNFTDSLDCDGHIGHGSDAGKLAK